MMLEYEWGNPAAAAAAMLLFGEDAGAERHHQVFDHYSNHAGIDTDMLCRQHQHQQPLAGMFPGGMPTAPTRYGLGLGLGPPPASASIGLNLGVRTYFSSGSSEQDQLPVGRAAFRRRTRTARCQAEGCGADLTHAKHYHRRHKVCEFHSKASIVVAAGLSQRFCQQCSRFHVLSEFDQGKRSCRKRLADHNKRRRKSQDLTTIPAATEDVARGGAGSSSPEKVLFIATATSSTEPTSSVTRVSYPLPAQTPVPVTTPTGLAAAAAAVAPVMGLGMSGSSSSGTSPPSVCFLSSLGEFRGDDHRFTGWEEAEDGNSMRGLFQSK